MFSGIYELVDGYSRLYNHIHKNYIVYVSYGRYKYLCQKYFRGLILSLSTPKEGINEITEFSLTEAILNIPSSNLRDILDGIDIIPAPARCKSGLVNKLYNFFTSFYKLGIFGYPDARPEINEQLSNYEFKSRYNQFFANFFSILSRLDLSQDDVKKIKKPLRHFIAIEDQLFWFDLAEMGRFLNFKGDLFTADELIEILEICVSRDLPNINKYHKLISALPAIIYRHYPEYRLESKLLVEMALLKCRSSDDIRADYNRVINLAKICNQSCQQILFVAFEKYLDRQFNASFYETLINETDYPLSRKGYFDRYVRYVNNAKDNHTYRFGKHGFTDLIFINFAFLIYYRRVNYKRKEFKQLVNLNDFERWLLDPKHFDYEKFNLKWLDDVWDTDLMKTLKQIGSIRIAVRKQLAIKYDVKLAEIYSKLTDAGK